ncbi:glucans biosynthesis glucosyltransferase MdoH [Stratiformator vulcanicus]|uniref:Glucans biosynthesis glucosyltransferase H n=1 Tax=Stratiformator vulcanicus TaxID=2527980 RepID=A0A517QWI0_9PLAN|nr:glucans biosynthesis glucosyltransferase MdoH [Stratiformator vulcanicus]QDT35947.1 Glucans biosynthesis glucosyltransferase H [Stratiformator vulcanicus]
MHQILNKLTRSIVSQPRDWIIGTAVIGTILFAFVFIDVVATDGLGGTDILLTALFAALTGWVLYGFATAIVGFIDREVHHGEYNAAPIDHSRDASKLARTAIIMPVYNEDSARVLAGLQAMKDDLANAGAGPNFDFFILSDSTDPDVWLEEELAWSRLSGGNDLEQSQVFYRHRPRNFARKAGNLHDFCERWGLGYRYMIVLDADSIVPASTLIEMVGRMEDDPTIGLLQTPPRPIGGTSLFARAQQFSAAVYGPIFTRGYRLFCGDDGNYWGHNAIIRIAPFIQHAGLPELPGEAPLGGQILSHDFVEAALLRRAGWKVVLADDLVNSFEELPNTTLSYAQRDQRWCQGNLQHLNFLLRCPLTPISRWHLFSGAVAFLTSPMWLCFLVAGMAASVWLSTDAGQELSTPVLGIPGAVQALLLFLSIFAMLIVPKFLGGLDVIRSGRAQQFGGATRLWAGVMIETLHSIFVAPIMMAFHSSFVALTLLGKRVQWNAQQRGDHSLSIRDAFFLHRWHTVLGIAGLWFVTLFVPNSLFWTLPVLSPLALSIPLSMIVSHVGFGVWLRNRGLLTIPEEQQPQAILRDQQARIEHSLKNQRGVDRAEIFRLLLTDPNFHRLHCSVLEATRGGMTVSSDRREELRARAMEVGPESLDPVDRRDIICDVDLLRELHIAHWADSSWRKHFAQKQIAEMSRQPSSVESEQPATAPLTAL